MVVKWSSSEESSPNAGDAGSIPGREAKIPTTTGQPSPCATNPEPECQS